MARTAACHLLRYELVPARLDQGEFATIPALPNAADLEAYEKARLALAPNLSRRNPAPRYGVGSQK